MEVSPQAMAWMNGLCNFQETTHDLFSIAQENLEGQNNHHHQ